MIKPTLSLALLAAAASGTPLRAQRPVMVPPGLMGDIRYLASDQLAGRLTGTPGADSAAAYIARRFAAVGLQPATGGWYQPFRVPPDAPAAQQAGVAGRMARNVIGILPGRDPELRNQAVIVGAHYDHLGGGRFGSLDPDSTGKVHNGADDNASGAAALIYIAEALAANPPARTTVFIAFSGEELGLLGSTWYVQHPVYRLDHTVAMINLDMVGRMRNRRLIVYGTATAREFPALLDSLNWYQGFDLQEQGDGYGPSDQASFYAAHLPVLYLFTDLHEDYHRTTDDWDKINPQGTARVIDFAAGLATALGNRSGPLTFVEAPRDRPAVTGTGPAAWLGTVPALSGTAAGVRLSGVRAGSPAATAGLRADDVIIRFDESPIPDLQALSDALRAHRAGDVVRIVVRRADSTLSFTATLAARD